MGKFRNSVLKYSNPHNAGYAMAIATACLVTIMLITGYFKTLNITFGPSKSISLWGLPCDTWTMYIVCHCIIAIEQLFADLTGAIIGPWMTNYVMNNNVDMDLKQGYGYAIGVFSANNLYGYVSWMLNFKTEVNTMEFTITQTVVEILVTYVNFKIYFMRKEERMKKKNEGNKDEELRGILLEKLEKSKKGEEVEEIKEIFSLLIARTKFKEVEKKEDERKLQGSKQASLDFEDGIIENKELEKPLVSKGKSLDDLV